jgi:hypothetical protein
LSGYNTWKKKRPFRENQADELDERVCIIFHDNNEIYGADRICGVIRGGGGKASFRKVRDIMNRLGLHSVHGRRRARSITNSSKSRGEGFPNLTKDLNINTPFQVLSSDISYIRTGGGFD